LDFELYLAFSMPLILKVSEDASRNKEVIQQATLIIGAGGVVAFPTETVYGLAAMALSEAAIERVYRLKGRARHKPLSILIGDSAQLQHLVKTVPPGARHLMARFWPGALTLIFEAAEHLPRNLTSGSGKVGVRISSHPIAQALVRAVGGPITATSANRSGMPSCSTSAEVLAQFGSELEAVVDGGLTPGTRGSTIADVTTRPPEILRIGAIAVQEVLACWRQGAEFE
jgi:L-threonylcarbamoyladenylate synthase